MAFVQDYPDGPIAHLPTHTHPDHQTSFINFLHLLQSTAYVLDSPFRQLLSRSSLVFLLVLDPLLHTPWY